MKELFDMDMWRDATLQTLTNLATTVAGFAAKLLVAILVLFLGWMVARIVQAISRRGLSRLGADRLLRRAGVADSLERVGFTRPFSEVLARLLFWLIMLAFLLFAVDVLGLHTIAGTINRLLVYVPRIAGAGVIMFVGLVLGRLTRNVIASGAAFGSPDNAVRLAGVANVAVILTASVLAVEQLGVQTEILAAVTTAAVAAFGLSMGVAFALGARGVVTHVLAGHFLRQRFRIGQEVIVDAGSGVITRVGAVDTLIEGVDGTLSIPNGTLLNQTVRQPEGSKVD